MRDHRKIGQARRLRRNLTPAEARLWSALRRLNAGARFRRQHAVGPYVLDFAAMHERLAVEVDGATHSTDAEQTTDAARTRWLEADGWRIFRCTNDEVRMELDAVLDGIVRALEEQRRKLGLEG